MEERKNVYLSLHKSFVREGIEYTDRATGEARTFNSATLPKGTVVDGVDVGGYEFSPMFVNESRFKGADFRDIPLLANREVWLRKTVMGPDGQPELDEGGRAVKDTVKVMPAQLKEAVDAGRSRYLAERAEHARQASRAAEHEAYGARTLSRAQDEFILRVIARRDGEAGEHRLDFIVVYVAEEPRAFYHVEIFSHIDPPSVVFATYLSRSLYYA